ncbi:MAG: DUF938 domain-containing protein [Pseudomonadota bacterium]
MTGGGGTSSPATPPATPPSPGGRGDGRPLDIGDARLFSPSFERNHQPIAAALPALFGDRRGTVLEIGSGSGQHGPRFAAVLPGLTWLPSDPFPDHRDSIAGWGAEAGLPNLAAPLSLDAMDPAWPDLPALSTHAPFAGLYAMNVLHITPWALSERLIAGAGRLLAPGGLMVFYGPYAEGGRHTGEGNARFDAVLRAENPDWGIRDLDMVAALAATAGFGAPAVTRLPANNLLVAFER